MPSKTYNRENTLEQAVKRLAKKIGLLRKRLKLSVGRGWPDDAVFLKNNVVVWLELKARNGRLSPQQKFIHEQLRAAGHEVATLRDIDAIEDHINKIRSQCPFCQSNSIEVKQERDLNKIAAWVECSECEARGPWLGWYKDPDFAEAMALEAWQR